MRSRFLYFFQKQAAGNVQLEAFYEKAASFLGGASGCKRRGRTPRVRIA